MRLPVIPAIARALTPYLGHVQAAAAALAAAIPLLRRKRLTWSACLDRPVAVTSGQPALVGAGASRALLFREHGLADPDPCQPGTERAWLVVLGIANHGLTPVHGHDFRAPLTFTFPGRVQAARSASRAPTARRACPTQWRRRRCSSAAARTRPWSAATRPASSSAVTSGSALGAAAR